MPPPERHWTYATDTEAFQVVDGFNHAAGFPKKGKNRGGGKHVTIPATYTEGAIGWSGDMVDVLERDGGGPPSEAYAIDRVADLTPYEGQAIVHPVHGAMTLPNAASPNEKAKGAWQKKPGKKNRPVPGPPPSPGGGPKKAASFSGPKKKAAKTASKTKPKKLKIVK